MKRNKNESTERKKSAEEEKTQVVTGCVHQTAEWLKSYSSILSDLHQASGVR